jgi:transcriptional regulator of acetoin/glycerol metabolism
MQTTAELRQALAEAEERELVNALSATNGSAAEAAVLLGVTRQTVHRRMRKYGLTVERVVKRAA